MLFAASAAIGLQLGHQHALDYRSLQSVVSEAVDAVARQSAGSQALLLVATLLAATGVGLVVQALAGLTHTTWLDD